VRRLTVLLLAVSLIAGCGGSSANSHGGFSGKDARRYDLAYKKCRRAFGKAQTHPGANLESLLFGGGSAHWKAFSAGCSAAANDAGVYTGSLYETTP
jgi:diaminopimelate decarboxylase